MIQESVMKFSMPMAALLAALTVFSAGGTRTAAAQPCTGPFVSCAIEVQAQCSRDANGRQRMTYWDRAGFTTRFEQCVGRIFEAAGQPNPYKTGISRAGNLVVPYTELLYPQHRERN
jgi:hypothetical protein